uniref:Uncharacterized protein n=1 Tax=Anguilla anguilla TaxID=7936 RepID=A0A0E9QXJ9_ANGAN
MLSETGLAVFLFSVSVFTKSKKMRGNAALKNNHLELRFPRIEFNGTALCAGF